MKIFFNAFVCFCLSAVLFLVSDAGFAQDEYLPIDSNTGGGTVTWDNTDNPEDGPTVAAILADAKKIFPAYVKKAGLPPVKSFFVKSFNTQRKYAKSWEPIDHIEAIMVGLTKPVKGTDYYLYNCEIHYNRPVGQKKWTVYDQETNITLGDGTPKSGGIHLIASDGTDKTQAELDEKTKSDNEEYRNNMNSNEDKKQSGKDDEESDEDETTIPSVEGKVDKLKGFFN